MTRKIQKEDNVPTKDFQNSEKSDINDAEKGTEQETGKQNKNKTVRKLKFIIIALVLLVLFIVLFLGSALLKRTTELPFVDTGETQENYAGYYGIIEGSFSYPSDFIPEMVVCAKNEKTDEEFCSYEMEEDEKYMYGLGYSLEVPIGTYNIYAQLIDPESIGSGFNKNYKAYYSEFVTCGMSVDCESHRPIDVEAIGGETVSNINPQDWYAKN